MKIIDYATMTAMLTALMLFAAGCNDETSPPDTNNHDAAHADADEHGGHNHPSHGPHDGDLIELGGEDYHAEIVHADTDEIVIYILGSDAKTAIPIDATEITINAVHDGSPEQFRLSAAADDGDPAGQSSRFHSSDAELLEHLHDEQAEAKLVVTIDGKQYTGEIEHDHGHDHE